MRINFMEGIRLTIEFRKAMKHARPAQSCPICSTSHTTIESLVSCVMRHCGQAPSGAIICPCGQQFTLEDKGAYSLARHIFDPEHPQEPFLLATLKDLDRG